MKTITLICNYCDKPFERKLSYHKYMLRARPNLKHFYCGQECSDKGRSKKVNVDTLVERYEAGESSVEIADDLDISDTLVRQKLHKTNVKFRSKSELMSGDKNPMQGKTHTPAAVAKIRAARKAQFGSPEEESRQISEWALKRIADSRTGKAFNKVETAFAELLDQADLEYTQQFRLFRYLFDFYLPGHNMLIEVHGTYWHADPRFYDHTDLYPSQKKNLTNDVKKAAKATEQGYRFEIFWEEDIYKNTDDVLTALCKLSGIRQM